ncbi:MAG: hypothetical protein PHS44_06300 [Candidatus Dojkabacteria bacterium]|nr:hypothetical protein [Candidatus Dojkabacteria bacterium]
MEEEITPPDKSVNLEIRSIELDSLPYPLPANVVDYVMYRAGFSIMYSRDLGSVEEYFSGPVRYRLDFAGSDLVCVVCEYKTFLLIIQSISKETHSFEIQLTGLEDSGFRLNIFISAMLSLPMQGGHCSLDFFIWKASIEEYSASGLLLNHYAPKTVPGGSRYDMPPLD